MPFQAIPIAFHKNTGSPLSKLLLIYLVHKCDAQTDGIGGDSDMLQFEADKAALFCQCTEDEVYAALKELHRIRLIWPDDAWVTGNLVDSHKRYPNDEYDFIRVALPTSMSPVEERSRFKASTDQFDYFWQRDGFRCVACGTRGDDVKEWHVDHIIPRSAGGADLQENCQAICGRCNSRKGKRVHWVDFLGGRRGE